MLNANYCHELKVAHESLIHSFIHYCFKFPVSTKLSTKVKHLLCEVVSAHSCCDCPICCCSNQGDNLKFLLVLPFESQK